MSNYPPPPPSGQSDPSVVPPGMYLASDGRLYPIQAAQQMQAPPPAQKKGKGGKVVLIVVGAIVALCALGGIVAAISGTSTEDKADEAQSGTTVAGSPATTAKGGQASLFPGRPDKKKNDVERNVGQPADVSGYTVTLKSAAFAQSLDDFQEDGYLVTQVSLANRDTKAQSYNPFDWKIITPQGTIIDSCFCPSDKDLHSGDLVTGGKVEGQISFEVGASKGIYYVIYDPPDFGQERAIWQVTI